MHKTFDKNIHIMPILIMRNSVSIIIFRFLSEKKLRIIKKMTVSLKYMFVFMRTCIIRLNIIN